MDFASWFDRWLNRHPLRSPDGADHARYTAQVMARIKAQEQPARSPSPSWLAWPGFALATVAAMGLLVFTATQRTSEQIATDVLSDLQVLAEVDEPMTDDTLEGVAEELGTMDVLVLAEADQSDDAWVEETLELLKQLDEEVPDTSSDTPTDDEEWLNELDAIDEYELSSSVSS